MFRAFFRHFFENVRAIFERRSLSIFAFAITATVVLVLTGADWWYYEHTRIAANPFIVFAAGLGGFFVPVIAPVAMYLAGEARNDQRMLYAGVAIAQAELIVSGVAAALKAFTGRTEPDFIYTIGTTDITHAFHFGFLQNGVFWGWPSSHTAVACAGAAAFICLYRSRTARLIVLAYAGVIAFGASVGFHWLSDVIAGAFIGGTIGTVVGTRFAAMVPCEK